MSADYFILLPDGSRDGPYAEEELLDLIDAGDLEPGSQCLHAATGEVSEAGRLFTVVAPAAVPSAPKPPVPVQWKPASPSREASAAPPAARARSSPGYSGNRGLLSFSFSLLLAGAFIAAGVYLRAWAPPLLAIGLLAGMTLLLIVTLRRMRIRYVITRGRVEIITGLLTKSSREIPIAEIRAITVAHPGLAGLLGMGSITFSPSPGAPDITFHGVWFPGRLKSMVRRAQFTPPGDSR
ncbi:MAG TPA: PH domain-containing protein [Verrucomicrobiales bacterium]|nr:PH domain-containing protein [Verrucomicrobiales bacterium]